MPQGMPQCIDWDQENLVIVHKSPPPETRECSSCGANRSLNFFSRDTDECRICEAQRRIQQPSAMVEQS